MKYIIPRERDGSLSASMVEMHDDDGSVRFVPLAEGNADADRYRAWVEDGGVADVKPAPAFDASAVAIECQRRIYAVASQNCQMNMTAWIASGQADDKDKAAFDAALGWVQAMRAACAGLIAASEAAFADDRSWPVCPATATALAARF